MFIIHLTLHLPQYFIPYRKQVPVGKMLKGRLSDMQELLLLSDLLTLSNETSLQCLYKKTIQFSGKCQYDYFIFISLNFFLFLFLFCPRFIIT